MNKYDILKKYFGYDAFRQGQETLIDAVLSGRDAFGIMPTGGGKSLCYQIPALLFPGITLVISPLISLMKDQVMALKDAGIPAAYINSSLSLSQIGQVYRNMAAGDYKIVYVAPERLETDGFLSLMQNLPISFLAVDEAHCISQWGQDFRPSYLKIVSFLDSLPRRPILAAYTATATDIVRKDVVRILGLLNPVCVLTGFDRPNLNFEVLRPESKMNCLNKLLTERSGKSGIIYCSTRRAVEEVCQSLKNDGFPATRYHAGLSEEERRRNQDDFVYDYAPIMVATNAFGMGIDKSNVSFVIHYNMPTSMEAYYQEAGRAGRDGSPADCILLYARADLNTAVWMIDNSGENDELTDSQREQVQRQNRRRLDQMVNYCQTTRCLRDVILSYFGEPHAERCENCGNCRTIFREEDITVEAQKILSCVERIRGHLGFTVGKALLNGVLRGSREQRILNYRLDQIRTYGIMRELSRARVGQLIETLEEMGYISVDPDHGGVTLNPSAHGILFDGERLTATFRELPERSSRKEKSEKRAAKAILTADSGLYDALKRLRFELSVKEDVPAYVIFSNATLTEMASRKPRTMDEFLDISGVGSVKAEKYGKIFLLEIAAYEGD